MKAISLWQPWASAMALGLKCVETRSWATKYRGPLAIHAALNKIGVRQCSPTAVRAVGLALGLGGVLDLRRYLEDELPFGAIVAVAELVDCEQSDPDKIAAELRERDGALEVAMGDWTPGRWLWRLDKIVPLVPPVKAVGRQGLFRLEDPRL